MELNDSRILVAGATGTLGGRLAHLLADAGAARRLAGRDAGVLHRRRRAGRRRRPSRSS